MEEEYIVNYKRVRASNADAATSDKVNYTKMFELIHQKYNEVVENSYQQLILVSGCGSMEEFQRLGYILKTSDNPDNKFNRTISLYKLGSFGSKHIMSLEVKADFSDGVVKFICKALVNEMEEN
ncbi:hypothetical protein Slash_100 [Bacillus phage Slash]|uniref:Uncharacterized protein n=1 Tax=Bacillus phage Slash TaxID=1406790 RepID=U5PWS9_9CAUD|nr:hypothetical protein Slash_100 [Bacillus phage Slash]AGY48389.1 hypothetical protein Slash_100 [Bacillus phage Slash]